MAKIYACRNSRNHTITYAMKKKLHLSIFLCLLISININCQLNQLKKPNIILIVADDLGWNDVSFNGSDISTPSIDSLASQGIFLNRFYVSPKCSPTRAGILTGIYPDRFNLRGYVYSTRYIGGLPPDLTILPEMLKEAGYHELAAFGKWHLGHSHHKYHPISQGFTSFYGHYNGAIDYYSHLRDGEIDWHKDYSTSYDAGYSTDLIGSEVVKFISNLNTKKPFFAYVAFNAPHSPMQAKLEELEKYNFDPDNKDDEYLVVEGHKGEVGMDVYGLKGRGNNLRQTYSAMVSSLDLWIGKILSSLKTKGIEDNTIVWFLSDNGGISKFGGNNSPLRGGKHTQWEGGVRAISIVKWPSRIKSGSQSNQLTSYIDIFPTLQNIVGITSSDEIDGINIIDAFHNKSLPKRHIYLGKDAIVSKKWKMNKGELFEIESDISEKNDLSSKKPEIVKKLTDLINRYKKMLPGDKPPTQPVGWRPPKNWKMPK